MTDRPIIFSAPMVQALLAGRKTQTRRVLGNSGRYNIFEPGVWSDDYVLDPGNADWRARNTPYAVGDRLWVRETWRVAPDACEGWAPDAVPCVGWIDYRAGGDAQVRAPSFSHVLDAFGKKVDVDWDCLPDTWRPSIFMPRWASRITLLVDEVRVQRLQDMEGQHPSESDAIAEGVNAIHHGDGDYYYSAFRDEPHPENWADPTDAFRELWNSIHGPDAWDANPWVVAVSFRVQLGNIDA